MNPNWIIPDWVAPVRVRACSTTRAGGISSGSYAGLNLGAHVGDDLGRVRTNRARLCRMAKLPAEPVWLNQVHGQRVVVIDPEASATIADASMTRMSGVVCAVMTADCLPVLLCAADGSVVAAIHAGWRGLAAGILESTILALGTSDVLAWLGPCIGPERFEIGEDVRDALLCRYPDAEDAFRPGQNGRHLADLSLIARAALKRAGIRHIHGGLWCTYSDPERFYSYRRDGITGRMASLIWLDES